MAPSRKTLKRLLAAFIVISVLALAGIFAGNRWIQSQSPREILEKIPDGATLSVGKIRQTATRDGVAEWTLTAESGRYDATAKTMELTDLTVVYFGQKSGDVRLEAREGTLKTETNSMAVSGDVSVSHTDYTLNTDRLAYDHPTRILSTDTAVHIQGDGIDLHSSGMTVDLNAETARFTGGVKGIINENAKP